MSARVSVCPARAFERVGVEDGRDLHLFDHPVDQVADLARLTEPGPDRQHVGVFEEPAECLLGGLEADEPVVVVFERIGHVGRLEGGDGRLDLGRAGDPDQPRPRAQRRGADQGGGAGHAAAAGDHEHGAVHPFVAVGRPLRQRRQCGDSFKRHGTLRSEPDPLHRVSVAVRRACPARRAISPATCPPLKPASILTATTFEAQLLSMPRSAASPPKLAP